MEIYKYPLIFMVMLSVPIVLIFGDISIPISIASLQFASIRLSEFMFWIIIVYAAICGTASLLFSGGIFSTIIKATSYGAVWLVLTEIVEYTMSFIMTIWIVLYVLLTSVYSVGLIISLSKSGESEL